MASIAEREGRTPLHIAAEKDDLEAAESLIAAGADIDAKDNNGATPLHIAVAFERLEIAQLLLESGAKVDQRDWKGSTVLHLASEKNIEIVKLLIEKGANLDIQDGDGWTALHYAASVNRLDIAKVLISADADPEIKDNFDSFFYEKAEDETVRGEMEMLFLFHLESSKRIKRRRSHAQPELFAMDVGSVGVGSVGVVNKLKF